jgi:hypothetical protein
MWPLIDPRTLVTMHLNQEYDDDRGNRYQSYQPALVERIHSFNNTRRSRDQSEQRRQDTAFESRLNEVRLNEEQNAAVRWAYVVDAHRNMRGQAVLDRITHIRPFQRRDPKTKMLESIIVPMGDIDLDPLMKAPFSKKLMYMERHSEHETAVAPPPPLIEIYD